MTVGECGQSHGFTTEGEGHDHHDLARPGFRCMADPTKRFPFHSLMKHEIHSNPWNVSMRN